MQVSKKQYIGYEIRIYGGVTHRGITSDRCRRLGEHQRYLGSSAKMRILTRPMSLSQAEKWESKQTRTQGYCEPKHRPGRVWVPPYQRHNGKIVRAHYRKA